MGLSRMGLAMAPLIQSRLPAGGAPALFDRAWSPLVNAAYQPGCPVRLPALCLAPNAPGFLAALGKPVCMAPDLESRPGAWWLVDEENAVEWLIFSDAHRKNHWKGGSLCWAPTEAARCDAPLGRRGGVRGRDGAGVGPAVANLRPSSGHARLVPGPTGGRLAARPRPPPPSRVNA